MAKNETKLQHILPQASATDHQALLKARVATPRRRRQICKTTLPWRRPAATAWATAVCQTGRTAARNSTFHGAGRPVLHRHTARFAQPYGPFRAAIRPRARPRATFVGFYYRLGSHGLRPLPCPDGHRPANRRHPDAIPIHMAVRCPCRAPACRRGQRRRQPSRGRAEARGLQGGLSACEAWH